MGVLKPVERGLTRKQKIMWGVLGGVALVSLVLAAIGIIGELGPDDDLSYGGGPMLVSGSPEEVAAQRAAAEAAAQPREKKKKGLGSLFGLGRKKDKAPPPPPPPPPPVEDEAAPAEDAVAEAEDPHEASAEVAEAIVPENPEPPSTQLFRDDIDVGLDTEASRVTTVIQGDRIITTVDLGVEGCYVTGYWRPQGTTAWNMASYTASGGTYSWSETLKDEFRPAIEFFLTVRKCGIEAGAGAVRSGVDPYVVQIP